jgi:hypothetical protein
MKTCKFVLAALVILVLATTGLCKLLNQTYWPPQWYGTWRFYDSSTGSALEYGYWYYDYPNKFLRQDNNISFCLDPTNSSNHIFCEGVFNLNNFYLYAPEASTCCLCRAGLGMSSPNWLGNFANSSLMIQENILYEPLDIVSTLVTFDSDGINQSYYQSGMTNLPVALANTNASIDSTQDQWVDTVVGPVPNGAYNLPASCLTNTNCPANWRCDSEDFFSTKGSLSFFLYELKGKNPRMTVA